MTGGIAAAIPLAGWAGGPRAWDWEVIEKILGGGDGMPARVQLAGGMSHL